MKLFSNKHPSVVTDSFSIVEEIRSYCNAHEIPYQITAGPGWGNKWIIEFVEGKHQELIHVNFIAKERKIEPSRTDFEKHSD